MCSSDLRGRAERANVRSISARVRVSTQMELTGEEQDRDRNDEEQPETVSTHLFGKTKLRQERLAGQAIRFVDSLLLHLSPKRIRRKQLGTPFRGVMRQLKQIHL